MISGLQNEEWIHNFAAGELEMTRDQSNFLNSGSENVSNND